ncbi:MAG: glycosyltransferase family 4 protein [Acidiferrobacteraceae bacterium]
MKICVISPGVVHAVPRTMALVGQFDEIHFIDAVGRADRKVLASHQVIYHGPQRGAAILKAAELRTLLGTLKPDAIVCHYASGDHFFGAIAYGRCPVATITMGHDVLYSEGDAVIPELRRALTRAGLRRSHYIAAKSRFLAERLRSYGVRTPIDVNYWGADLERYCPGGKVEARRTLGLDQEVPIILSPRAIEPRLNIHLIVEAFHGVLAKYPKASLVILGRSTPGCKAGLTETIARLGLTRATVMRDEVSEDTLVQYYRASDVVVSVGSSEGFPNTVLEVMACRVPVVIGRIPQIEELLEDGRNAWICDIALQPLTEAILDVLGDRQKTQRICGAAYETARTHADIKKNGIIFSNGLKQAVAAYGTGFRPNMLPFRMLYAAFRIHRKIFR